MDFNERESKFIQEYMVSGNGTDAAIKAGYSDKAARQIASRLLTKANIVAEIAKQREKYAEKKQLTLDDLLDELEEARQVGKDKEQSAGMVSATMGKAKLLGHDIVKLDHSSTDGSFKPIFNFTPVEPKATDESSD